MTGSNCHHHHGQHFDYGRAFGLGVALNVLYIVVEAVAGVWLNSLALLADAGHNLSDVLGLGLAWGGYYLSRIPPTERHTYGWRSTSILAALVNSLLLLVVVGGIVWEAVTRLQRPVEVPGSVVIWVAGVGVIVNFATAMLFHRGQQHDINVRGAYLHMAADAGVSLAVVVGGIAMWLTSWTWVDPVLSLLIAVVIVLSTWGLLLESFNLILHAVPSDLDLGEIERHLLQPDPVTGVHDLHVWAMSTTERALTVHLMVPQMGDHDELLRQLAASLKREFRIGHVTIQIEHGASDEECPLAPREVV